jgi:3'-phosphoadenosine 5'-phosphosulfate sulfotransferase (PAPS reductase)/FAD synthetase
MNNPYKISAPALISFSGGRTSGFMLKNIIDAYNGTLPDNIYVVFANTGKEMPQTLDFVRDCAYHWDIDITWLELDIDYDLKKEKMLFYKKVNYKTASRNGEPFSKLIKYYDKNRSEKNAEKFANSILLPNPVARFCTDYLKIRALKSFSKEKGLEEYDTVLGLRYDELRRVSRQKNKDTKKKKSCMPMYEAKDTKKEVHEFWKKNNFDLDLPIIDGESPHGNCDLCFLKSHNKLQSLIQENPKRAEWWANEEKKANNVFRRGRPNYLKYIELTEKQQTFDLGFEDDDMDCFCHD